MNSNNESWGNTPIMAAVERGNIECTKELIQAGAD